jgi:hypothetical protein
MINKTLLKVLSLPQYKHFTKISKDDWRDPNVDNSPLSLSSKGWFNHYTGESGTLQSLLKKPIDIVSIYNESTIDPDDMSIIDEYFSNDRSVEIDQFFIKSSGMRVNRYNGELSIITPMLSTNNELIQLHVIKLDQFFKKITSSRLLGRATKDRGILIKKGFNKLIQTEGLENAVVLYLYTNEYDILVTGPAVNWKRGISFFSEYDEIIALLDNDVDEASLRHSYHLGEEVRRFMYKADKTDANDAHEQGWFKDWFKSLLPVSYNEAVKCYEKHGLGKQHAIIEEFNKKHGVIKVQGKTVVMNDQFDPIFKRPNITLSSKNDFFSWYANRFITIEDAEGKVKRVNAAHYWFSSIKRDQYEGFIMDTEKKEVENYFNLWRGFAFEPKRGDCSLYYDHLKKNVAQDIEDVSEYILNWMADAIQNPMNLSGVSIVLQGRPGTGKTFFLNHFAKLYGVHSLQITNAKHITGQFNGHLKDCLLLIADEAFFANDKKHEDILKTLITEQLIMIEYKGKDAFQFKNQCRVMMASNKSWVVPLQIDDRRFFITQIGEERKKDRVYFKKIADQMKNGGYEALLYDLLHRDISDVNISNYPQTEAINLNKLRSLDSVQLWTFDMLCSVRLPSELPITDLYKIYTDYCRDTRLKAVAQNIWGSGLRALFPQLRVMRPGTNQPRMYQLCNPETIENCRNSFEESVKIKIKWEDYE